MEWIEMMRQTLRGRIIPAARGTEALGVGLPVDFATPDHLPPKTWGPREHRHPAPCLVCFLTGASNLWVEDRLIAPRAGEFLLLPSNIKHFYAVRTWRIVPSVALGDGPTALWFGLYPFGATAELNQCVHDAVLITPSCVLADRRIFEAADAMLSELLQRQEGYETVVMGMLLEILGLALRAPVVADSRLDCVGNAEAERKRRRTEATALKTAAAGKPQTRISARDLAAAAQDYLKRRYEQSLTLPDIARGLFVSTSRLSHEFKRVTGQSVMGYLTEVRIAAAKRLLQTPLSVARVAQLVGYEDPYYFSRVFRREVGRSPSQSRGGLPS